MASITICFVSLLIQGHLSVMALIIHICNVHIKGS